MDLYALLNRVPSIRARFVPPEITDSSGISRSLADIAARFETTEQKTEAERPVFILSAGWGAGSTLLQRLLISSGELAIWGEPLDHAAFIQRLCTSLSAVNSDWPPYEHFTVKENFQSFANEWTANLTPAFEYMKRAHRAFFTTWFGASANEYGIARWGIKEVRWTMDHARYLKWLFPEAKFIFIYRNLFDSYKSCKGKDWYHIWPKYKTSNIIHFGYHWRTLVDGFVEGCDEVGGMIMKYEDLITGKVDLEQLASYLGIESVDEEVFEKRLGSRGKKQSLTRLEEKVLESLAGPTLEALGYT